jgi:hypothetical protein
MTAAATDAENEAIEIVFWHEEEIDCAVATGNVLIQADAESEDDALRMNAVVEVLLRMTRPGEHHGSNRSFDRDTHAFSRQRLLLSTHPTTPMAHQIPSPIPQDRFQH